MRQAVARLLAERPQAEEHPPIPAALPTRQGPQAARKSAATALALPPQATADQAPVRLAETALARSVLPALQVPDLEQQHQAVAAPPPAAMPGPIRDFSRIKRAAAPPSARISPILPPAHATTARRTNLMDGALPIRTKACSRIATGGPPATPLLPLPAMLIRQRGGPSARRPRRILVKIAKRARWAIVGLRT